MPKTREQIKHDPVSSETWRNNRTAVMRFDPRKIRPLSDHVLVELDEATDKSSLVIPDAARNKDIGSRTGVVLAVGPGKWHEVRRYSESHILNPLRFKKTSLRPGDRVVIGHYSDWESWNCSADGHESRDNNIVLCQEADVRLFELHECEILAGNICIECGREDAC